MSVKSATTRGLALPAQSKVVQIVTATTSTAASSSSATYIDSNLTASITPTSASNKVLVFVNQNGCYKESSNTGFRLRLVRGATTIAQIEMNGGGTNSNAQNFFGGQGIVYLDDPATTSSTTYKTQFMSHIGTAAVGVQYSSSVSSIVLMEVLP